ncbi:hypothetical protein [Hyperthermus butylicus]|uniref:Uncharacterized protein n=1 Tax=Hyperthermus butylicus (strain DSM 5456 / JCM 9403 / PLM1-5) TaxID=415426 RepID=A2BM45_HYPBU|nr:hypothetical protein [Hyperthermus butylicus]ABM81056.1 hypothetical protein Hbut_1224 [Hyperthermus butylicus DSM 5456]
MQLLEAIRTSMRAARVPGQVTAKVLAHVESVLEQYSIKSMGELFELPDWNFWLVVVKSMVAPLTRILKQEGYCHANSFLLGALMSLDERLAEMIREWVRNRCSAGNDPCCKNPPCCNLV